MFETGEIGKCDGIKLQSVIWVTIIIICTCLSVTEVSFHVILKEVAWEYWVWRHMLQYWAIFRKILRFQIFVFRS